MVLVLVVGRTWPFCPRGLVVKDAGWGQLTRPISQHNILVLPPVRPCARRDYSSVAGPSRWLAVGLDGRANFLLPRFREARHVC